MNNETCIHGSVAPVDLLNRLHTNQGGSGRHKCPTCAYEQGFAIGSSKRWKSYEEYCANLNDGEKCPKGSVAPTFILKNLGINQGGSGRHKCPNCAFKEGFQVGLLENKIEDIQFELVPSPKIKNPQSKKYQKTSYKTDFVKREIENQKLGLLGELFAIQVEKEYLIKNNRQDLANSIQHTTLEIGDDLGYDIISFTKEGEKKYIEVKTTRGEINRPFYLTINEIEVSQRKDNNYYLYRIFDFDTNLNKGKLYIVKGNVRHKLDLKPTLYLAFPK